MQPILDGMAEDEANLRQSAKVNSHLSTWPVVYLEKADTLAANRIEIEQAFGRVSFDAGKRLIRLQHD